MGGKKNEKTKRKRSSMLFLVVSLLLAPCFLVSARDFGVIGLDHPDAAHFFSLMSRHSQHRVAAWDKDSSLMSNALRRGAISAFSPEHVFKFSPVVLTFAPREDVLSFEVLRLSRDPSPAVVIVWTCPTNGPPPTFSQSSRVVCASQLPNMKHDERGFLSSLLSFLNPQECPKQNPDQRISLWTSSVACHSDSTFQVCSVYARLPTPNARVFAATLNGPNTREVTTDDPAGFNAPSLTIPHSTSQCYSFVTLGSTDVKQSCVQMDPSFQVNAFHNGTGILGDSGWFCGNPASPNIVPSSAPKPPNTKDSILIAQFTVGKHFSVSGALAILGQDEDGHSLIASQPFACPCSEPSQE